MQARNIHLVGSIPLGTTRNVLTTLAETIGDRAKRYPDGETGGRERFIRWQERVLVENPQVELAVAPGIDLGTGGDGAKFVRGGYRLRADVRDSDISFGPLGYAAAALESYGEFRRLQEGGVIPAGVRFQVCLPTPMAFVSAFFIKHDRMRVEPGYELAMKREVASICSAIPSRELAIQWDLAYEIFGHDGGWEMYYDNDIEGSSTRVARISADIPASVELGIHLCYGDPGHKHMIEPTTLGTCVDMANTLFQRAQHPLAWIHMPVPRNRDDDAYFEPLKNLKIGSEIELYLGLIHYTDGAEGAKRRMATAAKHAKQFGIATECGFGRRDPQTIPDLLRLHVVAAAGNFESAGMAL